MSNRKEYILPNGKKAVFEYDVCGIGKVTLECMDELMSMITDRQQEWMPCSERLPKESGQYLVTAGIEQRQVAKGYYSAEYGRWYAVSDVSAWMPLPEPWEGADDK